MANGVWESVVVEMLIPINDVVVPVDGIIGMPVAVDVGV